MHNLPSEPTTWNGPPGPDDREATTRCRHCEGPSTEPYCSRDCEFAARLRYANLVALTGDLPKEDSPTN